MPGHCLFSIFPVWVLGSILVPVIRDCMIFWGDNFGPRSILCLQPFEKRQLLGTSGVFVCHIRASEDTVAPALRDCLVFPPAHLQPRGLLWRQLLGIVWFLCLSIPGLEGYSIPSCQGLAGLSLCQIQTSGDILAQLLGIVFFCLLILGYSVSRCRRLSGRSVYEFRTSGDTRIQLSVNVQLVFVCQ